MNIKQKPLPPNPVNNVRFYFTQKHLEFPKTIDIKVGNIWALKVTKKTKSIKITAGNKGHGIMIKFENAGGSAFQLPLSKFNGIDIPMEEKYDDCFVKLSIDKATTPIYTTIIVKGALNAVVHQSPNKQ